MLKVAKFGGSSVAGAEQFEKVKNIIESDSSRRIVVVSAAGKRNKEDHKLTDLLYLCHAHLNYGVSCDEIFETIEQRLVEIRDSLDISYDVKTELEKFRHKLSKEMSV
ncbi:MAG: aspartate kinase, partial [Oscillospiraceae bacterium]|nr:aspartate kinase [Oscillospiraceae bacterium]